MRFQDRDVNYMRDPAYAQRRYEEPAYMRFQTEGARDNMRDPAYAQGPYVYINNPDFVQYWLKKSFEAADKLARRMVIVGEDEVASGILTVKDFSAGEQTKVPRAKLADFLRG